jgi:hypothetical protein
VNSVQRDIKATRSFQATRADKVTFTHFVHSLSLLISAVSLVHVVQSCCESIMVGYLQECEEQNENVAYNLE